MDYQLGPGPLQVDQNTIDEKIKGDIGIVENGDVATHAITKGYYVIWKGDLYIAKTDISSGTTLSAASNGNLTAKPSGLGADVAALNSKFIYDNVRLDNEPLSSGAFYVDKTITKEGYIPFAIAGYDTSRYQNLSITSVYLPNNTTARIGGYNGSSQTVLNGRIYIIWMKNA